MAIGSIAARGRPFTSLWNTLLTKKTTKLSGLLLATFPGSTHAHMPCREIVESSDWKLNMLSNGIAVYASGFKRGRFFCGSCFIYV